MTKMIKLNHDMMEVLQSDAGGYTKALTTALGVPWPLVKGWRSEIEFSGKEVTETKFLELIKLRNVKCPKKKSK